MSRLKSNGAGTADLGAVISQIKTRIAEQGSNFASKEVTSNVLSMESIFTGHDITARDTLERTSDSIVRELKTAYQAANVSLESISAAQWEAGAMAAMAAGDVGRYAEAAYSNKAVSQEGVTLVSASTIANFDYRLKPSMEAYDDRELRQLLPFSIAFNIQAARQNEFSEAFYPTVVISPDQAGLDIVVFRNMVFNEIKHDLTGRAVDFHRRNVVDAVVDPSILSQESTLVVPVYITGNTENNAYFAAGFTAGTVTVDGYNVQTAPLAFGKKLDILGLATTPNIANGTQDATDALDHRLALKNVYLSVTGGGGTPATDKFKVDVLRLFGSNFQRAQEGADRQMNLNFNTVDVALTSVTKDIAGAAGGTNGALGYLAAGGRDKWVIRLSLGAAGTANLQEGNIMVTAAPVSIDTVWDLTTGEAVEVTGSALTALKADLTAMSLIGFDVYATRSNVNRRQRGLLADNYGINERHLIPLGAPISALSPVTSNRSTADLNSLINIARIRNDNNAVTQLLDYAGLLSSINFNAYVGGQVPMIEGVGRHLLKKCFYESLQFDVEAEVNSIKSHERADDVSAAIINKIRDSIYRAYRDTNYQAALDALTGGTGEKPTVVIGTDPVIMRHLIVPGDTRLAGIGFDTKVVSSVDKRVTGKVFVTFVRPNQTGPDPLSFGFFAWMPELASAVPVSRNGGTNQEAMVQPRTRHINTLPILIEIDVENLSAAVTDKTSILYEEV